MGDCDGWRRTQAGAIICVRAAVPTAKCKSDLFFAALQTVRTQGASFIHSTAIVGEAVHCVQVCVVLRYN